MLDYPYFGVGLRLFVRCLKHIIFGVCFGFILLVLPRGTGNGQPITKKFNDEKEGLQQAKMVVVA